MSDPPCDRLGHQEAVLVGRDYIGTYIIVLNGESIMKTQSVLCIRALRSAVLDAAVMPISELFLSVTLASIHDESPAA